MAVNHPLNAWNFLLTWFVCLKVPSRFGMYIPSGIREKKYVFPLTPYGACLDLDGLLPERLSVYLGQPKGLELVKDTWRKAPHNTP